ETAQEPPNYYLRTAGDSSRRGLTHYTDPAPQLRSIKQELVTYKRADGVPLSFKLYLPADYKPGRRLPTVVWAYPPDYNDAAAAPAVQGVASTHRFTAVSGNPPLSLVMQGCAVLDGATMPVVGDPATVNNTYIEQIVSSAAAAIAKGVALGVADRNRVGVGGH